MLLAPFLAAIADAGGLIGDKIILARRRMGLAVYLPLLFLFLFVITAVLVPFLGYVNLPEALKPINIIIFGLMVALAVIWNYFYILALQKEKLYEHEMIGMLAPAMTIFLASIFFPAEYNLHIFIAAVVAALALIFSRISKGHFEFDYYSINLVVAILLKSTEILVIKDLLSIYSPVSLYAFRTGFVFLFYMLIFRPRLSMVAKENIKLVFLIAIGGAASMILGFYGYQLIGVVQTTMILILGPVLVYLASAIIFKERLKWNTILAAFVILGCIIYVTYLDGLSH